MANIQNVLKMEFELYWECGRNQGEQKKFILFFNFHNN